MPKKPKKRVTTLYFTLLGSDEAQLWFDKPSLRPNSEPCDYCGQSLRHFYSRGGSILTLCREGVEQVLGMKMAADTIYALELGDSHALLLSP